MNNNEFQIGDTVILDNEIYYNDETFIIIEIDYINNTVKLKPYDKQDIKNEDIGIININDIFKINKNVKQTIKLFN